MSGFWYEADDAGNQDRYRNWIALMGDDRETHVDQIVLQAGPEEDYPEQTGFDFQPEALLLVAHHPGNGVAATNDFFIGGAARSSQFGLRVQHRYLTSRTRTSWLSNRQILPGLGEFAGFLEDGFRFNIPNPLPWDLPLVYLAMRGGGNYDCGVALSPSSPSTQQITGLPFKPSCILFVTSQVTDLTELGQTTGARVMIGAADDRAEQYSCWCGSLSGDIYTNQTASSVAISMNRDANSFAPIPGVTDYHPEQSNVAVVDSFDDDGFTLNWTKIEGGTARYFAWMAFEKAATGRWTYHHLSGQQAFITTPYLPNGLVMFGNQVAHEQMTEYNPPTNGSSIGMGFSDDEFNQHHYSFSDVDMPPFRAPQTAGNGAACAMGCMPRQVGGLVHDSTNDRVCVFEMEGQELAPIVGMNYRYAARRGHRGRMLHSFD